MKKENIKCESGNIKKTVLPLLINNIFHVTTYGLYKEIIKKGAIKNNRAGKFEQKISSHKNSYGKHRGYVCLFDLKNKTKEEINNTLDCYYFLDYFNESRSVYLILKQEERKNIITQDQAGEEKYNFLYIPYTECWYDNKIELSKIEKIIVVDIKREEPPHDSLTHFHYLLKNLNNNT